MIFAFEFFDLRKNAAPFQWRLGDTGRRCRSPHKKETAMASITRSLAAWAAGLGSAALLASTAALAQNPAPA